MTSEPSVGGSAARAFDWEIDVTAAADLGEPAHTKVTVTLPPPGEMPAPPIVAFAFPGAGYSRGYFSFDMPGSDVGGQAGWHARRGWIFVAVDSMGVGEGSQADPAKLLLKPMVDANHATVREVLKRLTEGGLTRDFPAVENPVTLGLGQSMGGGLTIVQQAHHNTYDGVAILGFSVAHTTARGLPGGPPDSVPFLTRDARPSGPDPLSRHALSAVAVNSALLKLQRNPQLYQTKSEATPRWNYHYDDVPDEIAARDVSRIGETPPWGSATVPGAVKWMLGPAALGPEAAAVVVPVLSAFGERDVSEDPRMEHKAFRHAVDFSTFICPRMGHMHNFASTRELLWSRIDHWGRHVADLKRRLPENWPEQLFSDSR